jgi:hypothetical protein
MKPGNLAVNCIYLSACENVKSVTSEHDHPPPHLQSVTRPNQAYCLLAAWPAVMFSLITGSCAKIDNCFVLLFSQVFLISGLMCQHFYIAI